MIFDDWIKKYEDLKGLVTNKENAIYVIAKRVWGHMVDEFNDRPLCKCATWARAGIIVKDEVSKWGHHPRCNDYKINGLLSDIYDFLDVENEGVSIEEYDLCTRIREIVGHDKLIKMAEAKEDDELPPLEELPPIPTDDEIIEAHNDHLKGVKAPVVVVDTMETSKEWRLMLRSTSKDDMEAKLSEFIGPKMAEKIIEEKWNDRKQVDLVIQRSKINENGTTART